MLGTVSISSSIWVNWFIESVNLACHYHEIEWDSTSHLLMTLLQVQKTWNTSKQKTETKAHPLMRQDLKNLTMFDKLYRSARYPNVDDSLITYRDSHNLYESYFMTHFRHSKMMNLPKDEFSFKSKTSRGKGCQRAKYSLAKIMTPKRKCHFLEIICFV